MWCKLNIRFAFVRCICDANTCDCKKMFFGVNVWCMFRCMSYFQFSLATARNAKHTCQNLSVIQMQITITSFSYNIVQFEHTLSLKRRIFYWNSRSSFRHIHKLFIRLKKLWKTIRWTYWIRRGNQLGKGSVHKQKKCVAFTKDNFIWKWAWNPLLVSLVGCLLCERVNLSQATSIVCVEQLQWNAQFKAGVTALWTTLDISFMLVTDRWCICSVVSINFPIWNLNLITISSSNHRLCSCFDPLGMLPAVHWNAKTLWNVAF